MTKYLKDYNEFYGSLSSDVKDVFDKNISKVERGLNGNVNPIKNDCGFNKSLNEIIIPFSCGYRIYFVKDSRDMTVLNAGKKKTQKKDIIRCQKILGQR